MKKKRLLIFSLVSLAIVIYAFNSNTILKYLFEPKVWAHKVNNVEKLHEAEIKFKGIELDIVFINNDKGGIFDIHHPPDSSINLSLTEYLQSMSNASECSYWLDFKNLNDKNELSSSVKLDSITRALEIDNKKIIVESTKPWLLKPFKKKGFLTAYYLPLNLHQLESKALITEIEHIRKNISIFDNHYISADYKDYHILKENFPESKKVLWFTIYGSMNRIKARSLLYRIVLDDNVDVLLIPLR